MIIDGRLPSVPEYYAEFIDKSVDLTLEPKQCCPFHKENTPSFSYNMATGRWSCFGQCHAHGDVIEMHRRWFHFNSRQEAESDLCTKYNVPKPTVEDVIKKATAPLLIVDEQVENNALYARACQLANKPERWLELDYVMSKSPFDRNGVLQLVNKWTGVKSLLED